ncbi:MAG TPA: DUF6152 family protein [Steroidobacteraceae bacterium]|jgi:hypothetical protein|nr:DUF6152 family protein [Steroidobacteraceae bacterium]
MNLRSSLSVGVAFLLIAYGALAHHSYVMFDGSKTLTVSGTIAKLEWRNPHVFVWVYVPKASAPTGYELYAFENGSTNVLAKLGWSKTTFAAGEKVTVDYWPLRDGRAGGHLVKATHADGKVSLGAGGPNDTTATAAVKAAEAAENAARDAKP